MGKTDSDPPLSNVNPEELSQESGLSSEETLSLISRLLDSKLDKKFSEFKQGLKQKELETSTKIKKLKTEAKASSSFQFKGNKLQFEFNSSLLDSINSASNHLLEGNLAGVNTELEHAQKSRTRAIAQSNFIWLAPGSGSCKFIGICMAFENKRRISFIKMRKVKMCKWGIIG